MLARTGREGERERELFLLLTPKTVKMISALCSEGGSFTFLQLVDVSAVSRFEPMGVYQFQDKDDQGTRCPVVEHPAN